MGSFPGWRRRRLRTQRRPGPVRAGGVRDEFRPASAEPSIGDEQHGDEVEHECDREGEGVVGIAHEIEAHEEADEAGNDDEGSTAPALVVDPELLFEAVIHTGSIHRTAAADKGECDRATARR